MLVSGMSIPFWNDTVVGPDGAPPERALARDGCLKVSVGSGLGIDLNEPAAREYAREGGTYFGEQRTG